MRRLPLRSPPRVRGKDPPAAAMQGCPGITPAYAGKSFSAPEPVLASRNHPRVCGEKEIAAGRDVAYWGSPPRMRGKGWYLQGESPAPGITPAYAGKRFVVYVCFLAVKDHPRVCGEKTCLIMNSRFWMGSPPRMRGKAPPSGLQRSLPGITPAYAGKSFRRHVSSPPQGDHPRVCGEKAAIFLALVNGLGSPPRMRGKAVYFRQ